VLGAHVESSSSLCACLFMLTRLLHKRSWLIELGTGWSLYLLSQQSNARNSAELPVQSTHLSGLSCPQASSLCMWHPTTLQQRGVWSTSPAHSPHAWHPMAFSWLPSVPSKSFSLLSAVAAARAFQESSAQCGLQGEMCCRACVHPAFVACLLAFPAHFARPRKLQGPFVTFIPPVWQCFGYSR
jgi:hypothetical protein